MRALLRSCLAEKLRQLAPHALVEDFKASIAQTVTSGAFAGGEGGVGSLMIPSENLRAQLREHGSGKQIRTEPTLGAVLTFSTKVKFIVAPSASSSCYVSVAHSDKGADGDS